MDRLPALSFLGLLLPLLIGCQDPSRRHETMERVNAVQADPNAAVKADRFCDVTASGAEARTFRYPELTAPAPPASSRPRWVNVWATWCKPCVEELPLLLRWQAQLARDGVPFDLVLLSFDADDDSIQRFRAQHPGTPATLRIKDPERGERWATSLGLAMGAGIPIQVFVDPRGRIRCARTGSVGREHLPTVRAILAPG
jgi:thiol-disulfide isomerase/thioredoxin